MPLHLKQVPFVLQQIPNDSVTLESVGLISGLPMRATIRLGEAGAGATFILPNGSRLPAGSQFVANSQRGITMLEPESNATLSIVEHCLAAVSLSGHYDLEIHVETGTDCLVESKADSLAMKHSYEMPLLDGSSLPWFNAITETFGFKEQPYTHRITRPFFWRGNSDVVIYCLPTESLSISYVLNYPHKDLRKHWATWGLGGDNSPVGAGPVPADPQCIRDLLQCRTFGEVRELPAMQASGLAKGVSLDNTLGLNEDNLTYTSDLRHVKEPLLHKMLDFVGDMHLSGIPIAQVQGHFACLYAGHASHLAFAQALKEIGSLAPLE